MKEEMIRSQAMVASGDLSLEEKRIAEVVATPSICYALRRRSTHDRSRARRQARLRCRQNMTSITICLMP